MDPRPLEAEDPIARKKGGSRFFPRFSCRLHGLCALCAERPVAMPTTHERPPSPLLCSRSARYGAARGTCGLRSSGGAAVILGVPGSWLSCAQPALPCRRASFVFQTQHFLSLHLVQLWSSCLQQLLLGCSALGFAFALFSPRGALRSSGLVPSLVFFERCTS